MGKFYPELGELINIGFPLWDFNYPIFDEAYRPVLENKITNHFYFNEIGQETPERFKHRLYTKLNEIMPYYNQRYKSTLLKFDPLVTDYFTESFKRDQVNKSYKDYLSDLVEKVSSRSAEQSQDEAIGNVNTLQLTTNDGNENSNGTKDKITEIEDKTNFKENELTVKTNDLNSDTSNNTDKTTENLTNTVSQNVKDGTSHTIDVGNDTERRLEEYESDTERLIGEQKKLTQNTTGESNRETTGKLETNSNVVTRYSDTPQANLGVGGGVTDNYLSGAQTSQTTSTETSSGTEKLTSKEDVTSTTDTDTNDRTIVGGSSDGSTDKNHDYSIDVETKQNEDGIIDVTFTGKEVTNIKGNTKSLTKENTSKETISDTLYNRDMSENEETKNETVSHQDGEVDTKTNTKDSSNSVSSTTNRGETVSTNASSEKDKSIDETKFSRKEIGRKNRSPSNLLREWRESFINVDLEIIGELEMLFMGVF